ncbi:DUF4209 domain-containing protein [Variovorax sp. PAMC26660]|uniref:DUF4209 domain-containing protein n=1 Tax=Variovorax sp. PAMC26660 TaxID=2762322 RepID=UPI00164E0075|nr:DUF4209 domain-containing protein [Variovorax sp. PAMC26660]QNK70760.1 DUF4209 domain-containing protein [Variovorax sp. PAMC26660]
MTSNFRPPNSVQPTLNDFQDCGWEAGKSATAGYFDWWNFLASKASEANQAGAFSKSRMLWLLADACSLRLTPANTNEPLRATQVDDFQQPRGISSFEPYAQLLSEIYPLMDEPLLMARLADVAWLARRPKRVPSDALEAIAAYRRAPLHEEDWFMRDSESCWRRGITLAAQLKGQGETQWTEMGEALRSKVESDLAPDSRSNTVISMSRMLLELGLASPDYRHLAELLVRRGEKLMSEGEFFQARFHISAAKQFFAAVQDEERQADMAVIAARTYAGEAAARTTGLHPSYAAATEFYTDALHELYSIPKMLRPARDIDSELRRLYGLLREAGARSMDEFVSFQGERINIKEEVECAYRDVGDKAFIEALRVFASIAPYTSRASSKQSVKTLMEREFFGRVFSTSHRASDGRIIQRTPAADGSDGHEAEAALLARMVQDHRIRIRYLTASSIAPAREQVIVDHLVDEEDLFNICLQSRIVPRGRASLVAKELKAGFDGDFAAALHLLIPQLENFVRVHLSRRGAKTARLETDGVLMELGLSTLVAIDEMESVFGPDLTFEIQALFCEQSGPNLRNDMAHGLLDLDAVQSAESIYAWWLIFKMVFNSYWITDGKLPPDDTTIPVSSEIRS